jgi:NADH-quinone oxidoreductase subunit F/NAD(P)H dehydrogenase (quinone)/NADP-reducing hydrogenase subunit HndC
MNKVRTQLMLCGGTGCQAYESGHLREVLQKELERQGLSLKGSFTRN